ncbi:fibronectin type III domain-containing protein [Paenibacillus sp. E194]|uniref:fibronectin type III domain-containing protein n=1 Tax=Paenibacillus sp. E194 TaxID=1458845 RepID=UPI000A8F2E04|nr:fibronectin type III domain-containing protein [Paenibacillus sp. E194]
MKKLGLSFMMLMLMLGMITMSPANAASSPFRGGLLDDVPIQTGTAVGKPSGTGDLNMTDNNTSSSTNFRNNVRVAWYDFATPQEISAVVVFGTERKSTMEFYDSKGKLKLTYKAANTNGIQSLPEVLSDVSTVVLKAEQGDFIREWNVFTKPSAAPSPTTITWSQGGDKFVYLEWDSTGAETYTVKRSESPSGLFEVIASNVTDTFYTDKSVNNGTTYYYAVSSVNEAGESANSMTNNKSSATPNATKYTGGLLDGVPLSLGKELGKPTSTERRMTDNSSTARSLSTGEMAWYTFDSPVEVSAVILNAKNLVPMEFYDVDNKLLYSYKPLENDKVETLPEKFKNVTTVVLKSGWITEWNVFGESTEQPNPASIQLTAMGGNKKVSLHWNSTNSAASYNIMRSTVAGGSYKTIATVTGSTYDYVDSLVTNGTIYYYVVTAVSPQGEIGQSNEASATPNSDEVTPPGTDEDHDGNRALLNIVLNNGISKEFDLSMKEVNAFIAWYEGRASGNGSVMFAFDKHNNNKGPFKNRKEYVFFDKIITFEVNGYDADGGSTSNNGDENHSNPGEEY